MPCVQKYNLRGCGKCSIKLTSTTDLSRLPIRSIFDICTGICQALETNLDETIIINELIIKCDGVLHCTLSPVYDNTDVFYTNQLKIDRIIYNWFSVNNSRLSNIERLCIAMFTSLLTRVSNMHHLTSFCTYYSDRL